MNTFKKVKQWPATSDLWNVTCVLDPPLASSTWPQIWSINVTVKPASHVWCKCKRKETCELPWCKCKRKRRHKEWKIFHFLAFAFHMCEPGKRKRKHMVKKTTKVHFHPPSWKKDSNCVCVSYFPSVCIGCVNFCICVCICIIHVNQALGRELLRNKPKCKTHIWGMQFYCFWPQTLNVANPRPKNPN